jgi:hypothetical protein
MHRVLGLSLLVAALGVASLASADVTVSPESFEPPVSGEPVPPEPTHAGGRGLVHKPMVLGLVAMLFLVMGAMAANDRHKKAASSRRG